MWASGDIILRELVGNISLLFLCLGSTMAKTRQAALIWSQEDQQYLWRDEHYTDTIYLRDEPEAWLKRLAAYTSFSCQGRDGHLTLLKEARPGAREVACYAYRLQGKRTANSYAGRTAEQTATPL